VHVAVQLRCLRAIHPAWGIEYAEPVVGKRLPAAWCAHSPADSSQSTAHPVGVATSIRPPASRCRRGGGRGCASRASRPRV
jgi:hypothetical protein